MIHSENFLKFLKIFRWPLALLPIVWGIVALVIGAKLTPL